MTMTHRSFRRLLSGTLAVLLVAAVTVIATPWWKGVSRNNFTAYFANTNGLYVGDEVRVLGVAVGTVDRIEPQPDAAKVTFSVDRDVPLPAQVQAVKRFIAEKCA